MTTKKGFTPIVALLSVLIPLVILLSAMEICTYDRGFFKAFQRKNHIDLATGKSYEELNVITDDLLTYIATGDRTLVERHFNLKEVTHMVDVYNLYDKGTGIRNVALVIIGLGIAIYLWKFGNVFQLANRLAKGFVWIWGVIGVFGLLILMDFTKYFTMFHEVFFDNDLWILDPRTDLMIQMLPEHFFSTIVIRIATMTGVVFLVCHILCFVLGRCNSKRSLQQ